MDRFGSGSSTCRHLKQCEQELVPQGCTQGCFEESYDDIPRPRVFDLS
jgi:hypothetical protein